MPKRRVPNFGTDEEAARFWDTRSVAGYLDELEPVEGVTFGRVRVQVSLRLPPKQFGRLKQIAAARGIDLETMLGTWVTERQQQEEAEHAAPVASSSAP